MKLLHNCVKEALRLHPPLVLLMRHVEEPFEYKGMQIPQDHVLLVSPSVAHRMPSVYANPDVYDPDRATADTSHCLECPSPVSSWFAILGRFCAAYYFLS